MKEIDLYYSVLFSHSEKIENRRKILLFVVLVCLSASLYATKEYLYALTASALILQIISMFMDLSSKKARALANDFQKISMLVKVFGDEYVDKQEVSVLKISAGSGVNKVVSQKLTDSEYVTSASYSTQESEPTKKLLSMIQENSYWNDNLYQFSYKHAKSKIIFFISIVCIAAIAMIPSFKLDQDYTVLRLVFTVMSFGIIYEFIEAMLKYKNSSIKMKEIDQKISRLRLSSIDTQELLNIFSNYHHVKSITPSIPKSIYKAHNKMLNNAWEERGQQ